MLRCSEAAESFARSFGELEGCRLWLRFLASPHCLYRPGTKNARADGVVAEHKGTSGSDLVLSGCWLMAVAMVAKSPGSNSAGFRRPRHPVEILSNSRSKMSGCWLSSATCRVCSRLCAELSSGRRSSFRMGGFGRALLVASSIFAPIRWEQLLCWGDTGSPVAPSHRDWQFCFAGPINA